MMKFFKYLIFLILTIFSIESFAEVTWRAESSGYPVIYAATAEGACLGLFQTIYPSGSTTYKNNGPNSAFTICTYSTNSGGGRLGDLSKDENTCANSVKTTSISASGWQNMTVDQINAYVKKLPQTACNNGCSYHSPYLGGDENSLHITYSYPVKTSSCPPTATPPSTPFPDGLTPPKADECKNAVGSNSYCDKVPNKSCPTGYKEGSFNGKAICIKESTKPDNPNDPNNPNNNSDNFDDSKIISAINASKDAITSAINDAVSSVSNALNTGFNSVTDAIGTTNSKLEDVKANQKETTQAVNQNTTAVNAVKDAINNLKASVDATSKDNKETTKAINDSANTTKEAIDKHGKNITDAINENTKATNAVKDAVSNIKIPESGGGTIPESGADKNGEKLDGIKDGVKEGNGLLKDIKDWLTQEPKEPESTKPIIEEFQVDNYEESYVSWSASCPPDVQVPISLMGQSSTLVLKWQPWCTLLAKIKWAIIACAYFSAGYIVLGMRG